MKFKAESPLTPLRRTCPETAHAFPSRIRQRSQFSITHLRHLQTPTPLPLHGLKILDLSRVLAGPFCTQLLADYGADVLKIEQPGTGDETRLWRTTGEGVFWKPEYPLMSLYYASINRNKRSCTINLKSKQGVEIVKEMIRESDVLVENFLPGKIAELGLGWEVVKQVNPKIIMASVSGYGPAGPSAQRAGYDAIALAEAGLLHITGQPDGPPAKPGIAIGDLCTGLYMHGAILAALEARRSTGLGCKLDASLFESSLSLLINVGLASLNLGKKGTRLGLGHPNLVPYGGYHTKDGRYMFIAANNNRQFSAFCKRIGRQEWSADERFDTNDGRVENRNELVRLINEHFSTKNLSEWLNIFEESGLPYGAINDVNEALTHPQAEARGMVEEIEEFTAAAQGLLKTIAPPVKFDGVEMKARRKPPLLGEHTDEVLGEMGYSEEDLVALRRDGVV
jgi:succinate--hydroxymethylglutarate CoA-transferase